MNQKKGIDKLTFYRYPLNYLVHWMIPLSLNFSFIQFWFLFQQFLNRSILFFLFSLIYLSLKTLLLMILLVISLNRILFLNMYDRWLTDFYLLILVFLCSIFLLKNRTSFMFRWNQLPSFFVLFLVSFDGFILIHMPHFVNTDFIFFCYFSVLFLPWMTAISFYLAILPFYLFIFPCYFSCQSSHFPV